LNLQIGCFDLILTGIVVTERGLLEETVELEKLVVVGL
jgi:hypothetical protein